MNQSTKEKLRSVKWKIKARFLNTIIRTPLLAQITTGISACMNAEKRAVTFGRIAFNERFASSSGSTHSLRRDIHRLEKGLSYNNIKANFGSLYLGRIVSQIICRYQQDPAYASTSEFEWGYSVLKRYFEIVEVSGDLRAEKNRFERFFAKEPNNISNSDSYPKPSSARTPISVTYTQLKELSLRRRSVRQFLDKPVERTLIEQAVTVALQAPSACNRQPFRFYILTNPNSCSDTLSLFPGARGFFDPLHALIVVVGDLSAYQYEKDRHLIYTDSGLASMGLILSLETLGLSTCCINWPDVPSLNLKLASNLGLEPYERAAMGIAIGYPEPTGMVPCSRKNDLNAIIKWK